ncbi:MAG: hydantoinase/oxoprolinase family protein [Rhodospirillaceae bacterium]|nr:hydantoinase/oxoprolinase family protein [Rhodospirillaceae bacterium]MDD9913761.1 hydantoinase/oxoprolinase family protein [Rhodospirillaceae bacterium]MDD9928253.1 hydantoinase/oxoprolinase family protein [Rhodospirillaceae bacterium]
MSYRIGVDIGGTFTDFALYGADGGTMAIHKQLTTPTDPSLSVLQGIAALLDRNDVAMDQIEVIAHGTTLVTNAVIERRGAKTGMLVTEGFMDIPDMRLEQRYDLFDLRLVFPSALVARPARREIAERVTFDGSVATTLNEDKARAAIAELIETEAIEALAVCFLHAYANPTHEQAVAELARAEFPDLYVTASADVVPTMREYERWTTACINAYTQPMFDRYLGRLESGLAAQGFSGKLFIMTSSGGVLAPDAARQFPVRMLESGPAAGVLMSALHGRTLDLPELLSFDMGGTTAKGALVRGGAPLRKYDMEVARVHDFKRGSGLPVITPAIDMIEIGAGGGSIAEIDERGLLRVGPRSAGADPGPACYGAGGKSATLTDANLVLGYLDPAHFLGGEMALDVKAAKRAIAETVAEPLELDLTRAAWGIHEIINEDVARAFRIHASERGFDYRQSSMVAFGGSGPLHAMAVARILKIPRVVFPIGAGVMSALGLLASPLAFELSRSRLAVIDDLDREGFTATFAPLIEEATGFLRRADIDAADMSVRCSLDMRYYGQGREIEIILPDGDPAAAFDRLTALFEARYSTLFSVSTPGAPLEIVNWKVEATGPDTGLQSGYRMVGNVPSAETARKGTRRAWFGETAHDCPVYDRYTLNAGTAIEGPALVEERESTCVIGPGETARVDDAGNLIAELETA